MSPIKNPAIVGMSVGPWLKKRRRRRPKQSMRFVAAISGVSAAMICRVENSSDAELSHTKVETVVKLARAYDMTPEALFIRICNASKAKKARR